MRTKEGFLGGLTWLGGHDEKGELKVANAVSKILGSARTLPVLGTLNCLTNNKAEAHNTCHFSTSKSLIHVNTFLLVASPHCLT